MSEHDEHFKFLAATIEALPSPFLGTSRATLRSADIVMMRQEGTVIVVLFRNGHILDIQHATYEIAKSEYGRLRAEWTGEKP